MPWVPAIKRFRIWHRPHIPLRIRSFRHSRLPLFARFVYFVFKFIRVVEAYLQTTICRPDLARI